MGQALSRCCGRRMTAAAVTADDDRHWNHYSDREEEFVPPSSSAQRRRRGIATTSLSMDQLKEYADDFSMPRRAESAAHELKRRGVLLYAGGF